MTLDFIPKLIFAGALTVNAILVGYIIAHSLDRPHNPRYSGSAVVIVVTVWFIGAYIATIIYSLACTVLSAMFQDFICGWNIIYDEGLLSYWYLQILGMCYGFYRYL